MIEIELYTFLILVELLMVIYAITAFVVYFIRRHTMHLAMGISFLVSLAAFALIHKHINDPEPWVVVIYNFLFLLSIVLIIVGFRSYYKLKAMPIRYILYLLISIIGTYFFTLVLQNFLARVVISTFSLILFTADALFETKPILKKEPLIIKRTIYVSLGVLITFFMIRFLNVLLLSTSEPELGDALKSTVLVTGFFSVFTYNFWISGSMLLESSRTFMNLREKNMKMESLAMLDPLMKIYNRNKLDEDMVSIVEKNDRQGDIASLLLMDLDRFKTINDQYGHDIGDQVLILSSQIISSLLREQDRVYRWGGDEFLILVPLTDLKGAELLAQRINKKFNETIFPEIQHLSVSIGCAQHFQYESQEDWFKRVDLTLYKAKQSGRNRIEVWTNTDTLPSTIAKLVWSNSFESGHAELDRQHKSLIRLSNELYDRLGSANSSADVDEILDRVASELKNHFTYEYQLIKSENFEQADEHRAIHDKLLLEYAQIREQLKQGIVNLGAFFNFVSVKIVAEHIIKEDTKFFALIKSKQRDLTV